MAKHAIQKPKKNELKKVKPIKQSSQRAPREKEELSRSMKGAIILLSVLVLLTVTALIAWEQFTVKDVVVNGLDTFNYVDVVKLTGIENSQSIFLVDLKEVEERIKANPFFDVVSVKMVLPSKIEITVSERIPAAVLKVLEQYLLLDENAFVLGVVNAKPEGGYPTIEGVDAIGYELGKAVDTNQMDKLSTLKELLSALRRKNCLHMISSIDISEEKNIIMAAGEDIVIKFGSIDNVEKKCIWVRDMVPSLEQTGKKGILYITDKKNTAHFVPTNAESGNNGEED